MIYDKFIKFYGKFFKKIIPSSVSICSVPYEKKR